MATELDEGANFNDTPDASLEALVRYQARVVRIPMDGATNETYKIYRRGGDLKTVIGNARKLLDIKQRLGSPYPKVTLQFVVFGHNEHQIPHIKILAKILGLPVKFKLSWSSSYSPIRDEERVRAAIGFADRAEWLVSVGRYYYRHQCYQMWCSPQVNWDGKFLGCTRNVYRAYDGNVFAKDFMRR
ncbi:MAG: hypothetical protein HYV63_31620 [Candidatus Schekmanbacteria bacterium]|nr:hypothetical protein [Candidatus Schekmanbacteria bacterium]